MAQDREKRRLKRLKKRRDKRRWLPPGSAGAKARKQSVRRSMLRAPGQVIISADQCYVMFKGRIIPAGPFEHAVLDDSDPHNPRLALRIPPGEYHSFKAMKRTVDRLWARDGFRLKINLDRSMEAEYIGRQRRECAKEALKRKGDHRR